MEPPPEPKSALTTAGVFLTALALCLPCARAEESTSTEERPKLILVLSGGGARGIAHIGALKVLEELHVAPDMVVGTSMGAIVGGLYAAGWRPNQIEELVRETDWDRVFDDSVPRRHKSFRRKQDDRPVLIQARLSFDGLKPVLPPGVLRGQKLELLLRALESVSAVNSDFDRLPIPFRAVATDLATGDSVPLGTGSLATAIRASMSIPGAFPPVSIDGRELVDGGVASNLPIRIAKQLGGDVVIAVDVSKPPAAKGERFESLASLATHLSDLLTAINLDRDLELLDDTDVLIRPELGEIGFISFDRAAEAIRVGELATLAATDQLRRFAAHDDRWTAFASRPAARPDEPVRFNAIRIDNSSRVDDRVVRKALRLEPPRSLEAEELAFRLLELYNTRYFGAVDFQLSDTDSDRELVVHTSPLERGRGSMQFGAGLFDDLKAGSDYQLLVRHQLLPVNHRGGEWENVLQVGTNSFLASEFYQPLETRMRWFVAPRISFRRQHLDIVVDGRPVAEYRLDTADARLAAGRVFGAWGELRASAFVADVAVNPQIGVPRYPSSDERRNGVELQFRIDTVDDVAFPRTGTELDSWYIASSRDSGSEVDVERFWGSLAHSFSIGELTLTPFVEYGENFEETPDLYDQFSLGGLFRLSGYGEHELLGQRVALARVLGYWRLFALNVANLRVQLYAGGSVEAGNVFSGDSALSTDGLLFGGSVWVGASTPLGPARIAWGVAEGGLDRIYIVLGDRF